VLHQIGSGALGAVFRSYHPERDRIVAVKSLELDLSRENAMRLAEGLQALAARAFAHPNVVPVIDAGLEDGTAFVVMEYVTSESLDVAWRQRRSVTLTEVVAVLDPVAQAIDAAALVRLGHGNLHPRDILLTARTHVVRVTGFGLVGAIEALDHEVEPRRPYAAPERLDGRSWDVRADVYALGAIAHELLTGRRPVGSGEQEGDFPAAIPPDERTRLRQVIGRALGEDAAVRFASAGDLVVALRGDTDDRLPLFVAPATEPDAAAEPAASAGAEASLPEGISPAAAVTSPGGDDDPDLMPGEAPVASGGDPSGDAVLLGDAGEAEAASRAESPLDWIARRLEPHEPPMAVPLPPPAVALPVTSSYPWAAIVAVGLAGLVLGAAIGFQFGVREGSSGAPAAAASSAPAPVAPSVDSPSPIDRTAESTKPTETVAETGDETTTSVTPEPPAVPAAAPEATQAAVDRSGRIDVRSFPPGAMVTLNGRVHGRTPLTIRDLELGSYAVQIARPGYVPRSQRVTLSTDRPSNTITVQLEEGGLGQADVVTGSIFVASIPRGAEVYLDGALIGTTPLQAPGLQVGAHRVQLVLEGYRPLDLSARVTAGDVARIDGRLQPQVVAPEAGANAR